MKVGSLVECIKVPTPQAIKRWPGVVWPIKEQVYTINSFDTPQFIMLDEMMNVNLGMFNLPCSFSVEGFREIQPPMSLEFIEEMQKAEPCYQ